MADRDGQVFARVEVELEAGHRGDEPGEGDQRGRRRPALAERERVAHHRALREAAERDPLRREAEAVEPLREASIAVVERGRIRVADLAKCIPVRAARRERERPAGGEAEQLAARVEQVEERHEVELVGPAAVQQDERALRLARGGARARVDRHVTRAAPARPRGAPVFSTRLLSRSTASQASTKRV